MRRLAPIAVVAALALAGCAADTDAPAVEDELGAEVTPGAGEEGDDPAVPGGPQSPAPGDCVDLEPAAENQWTVADAGVVTARLDADQVLVTAVEPAGGWEGSAVQDAGETAVVELFRDDVVLRLELEADDGGIEAELCSQAR